MSVQPIRPRELMVSFKMSQPAEYQHFCVGKGSTFSRPDKKMKIHNRIFKSSIDTQHNGFSLNSTSFT